MYSRMLASVRGMALVDAGDGRHDLARRAVAALEGVMVDEGLLHRMQRPVAPARPSIVVTCRPSTEAARVRQDSTRSPSTWTVQAPHWPWSQPFLAPVRSMCSRSASSREVRTSITSRCSRPLTVSTVSAGPDGAAGGIGAGAARATTGIAARPAALRKNPRRLGPWVVSSELPTIGTSRRDAGTQASPIGARSPNQKSVSVVRLRATRPGRRSWPGSAGAAAPDPAPSRAGGATGSSRRRAGGP